jgi:hypothetical protein
MTTLRMTGPTRPSLPRRLLTVGLLAPLLAAGGAAVVPTAATAQSATAAEVVRIEVLSGRGDLVTGGDALVRVALPTGQNPEAVRVDVDGRDVTSAFRSREGAALGVVTDLPLGDSVVTAVLPDGNGARLTVTNAPIGGPVFSGPQVQPWTCAEAPEGVTTDAQCNRSPTYAFFYKSTNPSRSGLRPYDPESPPSDVATTTTDQGHEVPFIVREETGVSVRDEYKIAVLYDPEKPFSPTEQQRGYNNKLVLTHGASCDISFAMGSAPNVLLEDALSRGFAVASHALDNSGHNCNIVTQAESLLVTKELVSERYGPIRYTIGSGCSGGALAQQHIANAYPGIYQGITPACSFTDSWSSTMQREDYTLLRRYFENPTLWAPDSPWTPAQMSEVYGHPNPSNPISYTEVIKSTRDPSRPCSGLEDEDVYSAENPDGVRCALQDYMVNVFGLRGGDDVAGNPLDNTGIQYGLAALQAGLLAPSQFVDVNTKIGGRDIDYEHQAQRQESDRPALERAYRSGAVNTAEHLDQVAIIDLRGPDPGAFHDVYRTYAMRERLLREHGTADNQVLWRGQVPLFGDTNFKDQSIVAMDSWLAVVEQDTRDVPLAQKILEARQVAGVQDRCTDGAGTDIPSAECDAVVESYSTPRIEAGMPLADDTLKCRLVPLVRESYGVTFTDAQWERLQGAFPNGVCDYTQPSVGRERTQPWLTYQNADGSVVYGGTPMGAPPVSVPFGPGGVCDDAPVSSVSDRDQAREVHRRAVDCVLHLGVARGTSSTTYTPRTPVTRAQMASFLVNALEASGDRLPAAGSTDAFRDIAASVHRDNINRLAAAGITNGTGGGSYSPDDTVSRAEMASFVVRAARLATGRAYDGERLDQFADVPADSVHAGAVAAGYEAGLFRGTTSPTANSQGAFSPAAVVERDQMARFLVNLVTQARSS